MGFNLSERERQLAGLFLRCLVRANEYGPVDVGAFIHSFREYLYGSFVPPEKKKPLRQCKCLYCGADFFTEKENRKFCSVLCVSEWNRKYRVAERK